MAKNSVSDQDVNDIMYQLLLSYIYMSKVTTLLNEKLNNAADNKNLFCYSLKTITSPIVFSYILGINKDIFLSSIVRIYRNNRDNGFYKNFESEIKKLVGVELDMNTDYVTEQVNRIYDSTEKMKDKLKIDKFFTLPFIKLAYKDFLDNKSLTIEDTYKICEIDWSFVNTNKVDLSRTGINSYDTIPLSILMKYGLTEKKYDNSVIVRYFDEKFSDLNISEQIKKINTNVYDILDSIEITEYPVLALRALYFWDISRLPKNINYTSFVKMVEDSDLDKPMLISMILDKRSVTDDTFYNSFLVAAN